MSPWQKFTIGSIAIALLSSSAYYQTHAGASVTAIVFAALAGLGSYFWGVVSPNPFQQNGKGGMNGIGGVPTPSPGSLPTPPPGSAGTGQVAGPPAPKP